MVKDRFPPNEPIPLFLSGPNEETERSGVRKVVSSEVFRKAALVFAAVAIVFAVVSVGNAILVASVTASQVSTPAPWDGSATPAVQSTASAEAVPGTPRAMNWLLLLDPPSRIRSKSIRQEPKLCSINSRLGRLRKQLKHRPGPNKRSKMSEQILCNPRLYQSVGRSRSHTPLGHGIRRRKMPSRSCDASVGRID